MAQESAVLASWEKHTKGIGSKLLQKFGFKGRLGANETGISSAIEVSLRPARLGLGFGDEGNSKDIREEVSIKYEEKAKRKAQPAERADGWKKTKYDKAEVNQVTGAQLLEQLLSKNPAELPQTGRAVVIDMRFKEKRVLTDLSALSDTVVDVEVSASITAAESDTQIHLGRELLFNLDLLEGAGQRLLDCAAADYVSFTAKAEELKAMHVAVEDALNRERKRLQTLHRVQSLVQELNGLFPSSGSNISSTVEEAWQRARKGWELVSSALEEGWEGRELLHFLCARSVAALCIICTSTSSSMYGSSIHTTNNISADNMLGLVRAVHGLISTIVSANGVDADTSTGRSAGSMYIEALQVQCERQVFPLVRTFFSLWSPRSNDANDTYECVEAVRLLQSLLSVPTLQSLWQIVLSRLQTYLEDLHPQLPAFADSVCIGSSTSSRLSVHAVVLPWVGVLKKDLSALFPPVRRLLLRYLQLLDSASTSTSTVSSAMLVEEAGRVLAPWSEVFDAASAEILQVRALLPLMVRALGTTTGTSTTSLQVLRSVGMCMSTELSVCLWSTQCATPWLRAMQQQLFDFNLPLRTIEMAQWYEDFAKTTPEQIRSHDLAMQYFNLALNMMADRLRIEQPNGSSTASRYEAAVRGLCDDVYTLVRERKESQNAAERLRAMQSKGLHFSGSTGRYSSSASTNAGISMREALANAADARGLCFAPQLREAKGREVWTFGVLSICWEDRILYVDTGSTTTSSSSSNRWTAISLEDLIAMASSKS
jgi:hypothetical protein